MEVRGRRDDHGGGVRVRVEQLPVARERRDAFQLPRRRLESRNRGIAGFIYEPSWDDVMNRAREYEPCAEDRLVIDAVHPLEQNLATAIDYVRSFT